jgi:hypothetical protein
MKKILFTIFLFSPLFCFAMPAYPMAFWGNVNINNSPAPVGTIINAYYDGTSTLAGQVTINASGVYGYNDPLQQQLVVGEGTGTILFTFQTPSENNGVETSGTSIQSYSAFSSGTAIEQDLNFQLAAQTNPSPTSPVTTTSTSGGGGGGGGSVGSSVSVAPTITSTSTLSSVGISDFVLLMANWGQSGSGNLADFSGDSTIGIQDFVWLMANWTN